MSLCLCLSVEVDSIHISGLEEHTQSDTTTIAITIASTTATRANDTYSSSTTASTTTTTTSATSINRSSISNVVTIAIVVSVGMIAMSMFLCSYWRPPLSQSLRQRVSVTEQLLPGGSTNATSEKIE